MSGISRCSGRTSITPLFGVRVPVQAAPARRSGKGQRHRDDLHLRRRHRRDVVARAGAAGAGDHPAGRHAGPGVVGRERLGVDRCRSRAALLRRARPAVGREGAGQDRRAAARDRRSHRRSAPDHARRQVLREGRSAARNHHQPPVVHQDDRLPRRAARAGARAAVASAVHAGALRELGQRPERRLVRQPPAVLRRAVSRVVSARCGWPRQARSAAAAARRCAADRSVDGRAGRLSAGAARRARRIRRRSGRHGHLGDLVADAADRVRVA